MRCKLSDAITVTNDQQHITLDFNVLEWFKNPIDYSLIDNGPYTMGIDSLMEMIVLNGHDVLTMVE